MIRTVWLEHGAVHLVDQTRLPQELQLVCCFTPEEVADAIRTLRVRGAPAIGVTAAYGMALAASRAVDLSTTSDSGERVAVAEVLAAVEQAAAILVATRPTAVNLNWAAQRMLTVARRAADGAASPDAAGVAERLRQEADTIAAEDRAANEAIGRLGETLIRPGERIMTYCHTGGLATAGYGTAFGILRAAHETGKGIHVIACETRPVLQGARLTAWELQHYGVPTTLITDNAAAALMARGEIDRVIVGADRIAANGDVANKIGTYALAVLAHAHALPFIVAAPTSTIDLAAPDGGSIPIEERAASEVTHAGGRRVAPEGVTVRNPAFDVTPHHLVNAIVTEGGIARPPYDRSLAELVGVVTRST